MSTVAPTSGVSLSLILPQSLRCPADPYFSQVATHYPHLHRIRTSDGSVQYGHYEDPTNHQLESRLHKDMKGNLFFCSGYRAIHWNPTMTLSNQMKLDDSSTKEIIKMAAVLAYFTSQSISLRSESSKLLLLTPHNDTVADLEAMLSAPETDYPPTLYDFFLTCIYRKYYLSSNLNLFPTTIHGAQQPAVEQNVSPKRLHDYIEQHSEIKPALVQRCSLTEIADCCLLYTRGFATYCTISNTVKAIGIGGAASLFISIKMPDFLSSSPEADARNLVALTRSKSLSLLVLSTTTKYFDSALHSITTQCSVRHGRNLQRLLSPNRTTPSAASYSSPACPTQIWRLFLPGQDIPWSPPPRWHQTYSAHHQPSARWHRLLYRRFSHWHSSRTSPFFLFPPYY